MADQKLSNRERLREITDGIEQGIKELFESDKYRQYLSTMSRFHRYSVNNTMLIYMQKPDATLVAGFNRWKNQFERHVKKGEHGITIIAPTPFKKKIEEQKIDPDTKAPMLDKDGRVLTEEKEVEIPMFRPVKVFDLSQTDGKPLPQLAASLSGAVDHYEEFLEALRRSAPVPITFEPMSGDMDGFFSKDQQRIAVREGMSEVQTISATVHEIAHSKLHNYEQARQAAAAGNEAKEPVKPKDRHTEEVEAESISYAVCQYYSIQTGENSFGYIASWSEGKDLPELKASLETINKTASGLISDIDKHFAEICKERGIDLTAEPLVQAEKTETLPKAGDEPLTFYVAECMEFPSMGEYHENLSLQDALRLYEDIPAGRINGVKGIGFELHDNSDYDGPFPIVTGKTIDLESINHIAHFRDDPAVQAAIADVMSALPDAEILRSDKDEEMLFLVDEANYLHIQTSEEGYDYTIYDAKSKEEIDGGCLANMDISLIEARREIFAIHGMPAQKIEAVEMELLDELQETQIELPERAPRRYAVDENGEVRRTYNGKLPENFTAEEWAAFSKDTDVLLGRPESTPPADMLPETPEQALDEYPLPDADLKTEELAKCGYLDGDLLPLSKDRAMELYERDLTVYTVQDGGKSEMIFDREDFDLSPQPALYAVDKEEWEQTPEFIGAVQERLYHQEERERAFLAHEGDCFAIYQVKDDDDLRAIRFEGTDWLESVGRKIEKQNYDLVYTAPLSASEQQESSLDRLWYQFNNEHPSDYLRPSMSVSDIVALKQNGVLSCHYVDSVGFTELPDFLPRENYLKNAEVMTEDDYGMIDGIINNGEKKPTVIELEQQARSGQPISLMDLADAIHREQREKKKSVMEQLKTKPQAKQEKTAPKKSAEREL